jgi:hypothetical protein
MPFGSQIEAAYTAEKGCMGHSFGSVNSFKHFFGSIGRCRAAE